MIKKNNKTVWITLIEKYVYLLSVIEIHTRRTLKEYFFIQNQVIVIITYLIEGYNYLEIIVNRNDNESQFIVKKVGIYFGFIGIRQEFTHLAKPEENAHTDIYHINKLTQYITYFFRSNSTFSLSFYLTLYVQSQGLN
jgi:putative transposase